MKVIELNKLKEFSIELFHECRNKHILTLASSTSFFLMLTIVPAILLIIRSLGFFIGEEAQKFQIILSYLTLLIPTDMTGVVDIIGGVIKQAMFAQGTHNLFNFIFLFFSSLGFVNSIWRSMAIICDDSSLNNYKKFFKGIGLIFLSFNFFLILFWIPSLFEGVGYLMKSKVVVQLLTIFSIENQSFITDGLLLSLKLMTYVMIMGFITLLFKYILAKRGNWKASIAGALVFTLTMYIVKQGFFFYVNLAKSGLIQNYGASYTLVLLMIWTLVSMILFYFSIIFSMVLSRRVNFHS